MNLPTAVGTWGTKKNQPVRWAMGHYPQGASHEWCLVCVFRPMSIERCPEKRILQGSFTWYTKKFTVVPNGEVAVDCRWSLSGPINYPIWKRWSRARPSRPYWYSSLFFSAIPFLSSFSIFFLLFFTHSSSTINITTALLSISSWNQVTWTQSQWAMSVLVKTLDVEAEVEVDIEAGSTLKR